MNRYEKLAGMMRDAINHPEVHPEVIPAKRPKVSKNDTPAKFNGWIKKIEDRQDEDNRHV